MREESSRASIDIAHIPAESNAGGFLFAIGTVIIFLIGVPAIRPMFAVAVPVGVVFAFVLRITRPRPRRR